MFNFNLIKRNELLLSVSRFSKCIPVHQLINDSDMLIKCHHDIYLYWPHTVHTNKTNTAWKRDSVLTRVGWVRLCSWPGCTVPDRTGPEAGLVSLWEECRGRKQEPLAVWLPSGWKARGSNCSVLHPDLRSVGWTLGRSPWQWTVNDQKLWNE